ncbi:hypothetical protein D1BOALGB6SA_1792 [Olavius sp. associated proteobacterium Delta 1]|nr:hypothetical protein D1BOALGB6SA_1792 [Olavius sp. associated proteobacterium Delta 1]
MGSGLYKTIIITLVLTIFPANMLDIPVLPHLARRAPQLPKL